MATFISHETLGTCTCGEPVILVLHVIEGFRYCLGCERTGPDVMLMSEAKTDDESFDADDFTQVSVTPWELLQAARR